MMTDDLPDTIELHRGIPRRLGGGAVVGGSSYLDDQGELEARLAIKDGVGERSVQCHEGDTFDFAGASWRVAEIFHARVGGRPRVATLSKVQ